MLTVQQAFELALQHHQSGRLREAETLFRNILDVQPNHPDALHLLGVIALQVGNPEVARQLIGRAIAIQPSNPAAFSNLGAAFRALGRGGEAVAACKRAVELKSDFAEAYVNLGNALRQQGEANEALAAFRSALQLNPEIAEAHNNLGNIFWDRGHLDEAATAYRRALELRPIYAEAHNNLGSILKCQGRLDEAIAAFRRAIELRGEYPEAYSGLGCALMDCGQLDEAVAAMQKALELNSELAEVHSNLGNVYKEQGQLDDAIASYRRALQIEPRRADLHSNLIYALLFHPRQSRSTIAEEERCWCRGLGIEVHRARRVCSDHRNAERRLTIGYVSPQFGEHVTGRYLAPLLRHHDHMQFEIIGYSGVIRGDPMTDEFQGWTDRWRSTVGMADEALLKKIQEDEVDILVDLTQHLGGNRLPVFAHNPVPVQVSFAGYPEGTGLEAIRFRISDKWLEGSSQFAVGRSEIGTEDSKSAEPLPYVDREHERAYLLDSFWCYDPCGMDAEVNELQSPVNGYITFGCLNNFCKVNEPLLRLWARVLVAVPYSRMVILCGFGSHRQRALDFLENEGVRSERVEFISPRPRKEYLELYHRLDVVLDTFPYNGHTTSLDALWMGVPVVSLSGERPVSRGGLSQLSNLGLPELVGHTEEEYVAIATQLANDLPKLAELRRTLRARMEASVLMDGAHFARSIEAAYRAMWRRWCEEKDEG